MKMLPVAAVDIPNPSAVKSANVCSIPANQSTIAKLTATAAPMPGTATAVRIAARSSGTARRTDLPRRSGGSDSGSVRSASRKFTAASPAATKAGRNPSRPNTGNRDSSPPMNGPRMKPRPNAMPMIPMPRARCSGGVTSAT